MRTSDHSLCFRVAFPKKASGVPGDEVWVLELPLHPRAGPKFQGLHREDRSIQNHMQTYETDEQHGHRWPRCHLLGPIARATGIFVLFHWGAGASARGAHQWSVPFDCKHEHGVPRNQRTESEQFVITLHSLLLTDAKPQGCAVHMQIPG